MYFMTFFIAFAKQLGDLVGSLSEVSTLTVIVGDGTLAYNQDTQQHIVVFT